MLAMSENAGTLAQQIGEYLATQGSTAEMKALGTNIVSTAAKLSTEVKARRTRKAPSKSLLPAGLSPMNVMLAQKKALEATTKKAMANAAAATTGSAAQISKGIFGRAMETLKSSTQKEQPKGPISIAQAFGGKLVGGYRRRTRRVARKNFA